MKVLMLAVSRWQLYCFTCVLAKTTYRYNVWVKRCNFCVSNVTVCSAEAVTF